MTDTPSCFAIIPARGGSKGVPRKNIRLLAGQPLIAWTIQAARRARHISRVIVSTDDAEIAQVAKQFGAQVIDRPGEISGDTASSESALLHALDHLRRVEQTQPDLLAFLQCTSPLTTSREIDDAIETLLEQQADTLLSATRFFHFLWRIDPGGARGINHDSRIRQRRQDRPGEFLENGAIYVMRTQGFLAARHRFFGKTAIFEMHPRQSIEIDEPDDFAMAEMLLGRRKVA